ncbi:MAG: S8 family peptidase [Clostridiales bacterium]|nr:S8 family peptidase [Clostridiales bacterium]
MAAGNGAMSFGRHRGVAPQAGLVAVKVLDDAGRGNATDALAGIQWVIDNRERYNIRVANLSIGTIDVGSTDPLVRAVEAAWDVGIVMVVAAGNNGPKKQSITSPGTSRKAITVGASDDQNFVDIGGSNMKDFSGRGPTSECIIKPDIVAPGCGIISCLTNSPELSEKRLAKMKVVDEYYVQMSGTSMASPRIAGAVALLLSKYPDMTPNEVKLALKRSAIDLRFSPNRQGWGILDIDEFLKNPLEV